MCSYFARHCIMVCKYTKKNRNARGFEFHRKDYVCQFKKETLTLQTHSGRGAVGSAPGLGPGGRKFESCHPDNKLNPLKSEN